MNPLTRWRHCRRARRYARLRELYDVDRWLNDIREQTGRRSRTVREDAPNG